MGSQPITNTTPSNLHIDTSDLLYLLNLIKNEVKTEINCHAIGTIQTFDPVTQTCKVLFNYQKVLKKRNAITPSPNQFTDVVIPYPMLFRVPVMFLGGGVSYLTFPVTQGDTCLVLFCDRDIDGWLESGQVTNPPFTERLHDLSDAVAIVGVRSVTTPLQNFDDQRIKMVDTTGPRLPPSGGMMVWPATVIPSGWLLCDGSSYSTTSYPFLFAVIGYTWGGSGANFYVPDMRGNVPAGIGGTLGLTLGQVFGEVTHLLTGPESGIQAHVHSMNASELSPGASGPNPFYAVGGAITTGTTGDTDAETAHNNVQPTMGINWIIKI